MAEQKAPDGTEQQQMQSEVVLMEKDAHAAYSNFARVTLTPEEVIIDFALNPNPFMPGKQEVQVSQRLILSFYTAKRLLNALAVTLQRHESTFGVVELNVQRRANVLPGSGPSGPGAPQGFRPAQ